MSCIIPVVSNVDVVPSFRFNLVLDNGADVPGSAVQFRFDWQARNNAWYFSLFDADGVALLTGQRLNPMANWLLASEFPPGMLLCLGNDDYVQGDLGKSLILTYCFPLPPPPETLRMTLS